MVGFGNYPLYLLAPPGDENLTPLSPLPQSLFTLAGKVSLALFLAFRAQQLERAPSHLHEFVALLVASLARGLLFNDFTHQR